MKTKEEIQKEIERLNSELEKGKGIINNATSQMEQIKTLINQQVGYFNALNDFETKDEIKEEAVKQDEVFEEKVKK